MKKSIVIYQKNRRFNILPYMSHRLKPFREGIFPWLFLFPNEEEKYIHCAMFFLLEKNELGLAF